MIRIRMRLAVLGIGLAKNQKKKEEREREGNEGHFGKIPPELKLPSFSLMQTPSPILLPLSALHLQLLLYLHTCSLKLLNSINSPYA